MHIGIAPAVNLEHRNRAPRGRAPVSDAAVVRVERARARSESGELPADLAAGDGVYEAATDGEAASR